MTLANEDEILPLRKLRASAHCAQDDTGVKLNR